MALFRLWQREWSQEEVSSQGCVEGELVTWWWEDWDTWFCPPLTEPSLSCGETHGKRPGGTRPGHVHRFETHCVSVSAEWSSYEVQLLFSIFWSDGSHTELHAATEIAQRWVKISN